MVCLHSVIISIHPDFLHRSEQNEIIRCISTSLRASNLCTEIVQYSSTVETAVCTLVALCLPRYVRVDGTVDYDDLYHVNKTIVRILDKVVDRAHFPTSDAAVSAYSTRSTGIGTQGLADVFAGMELPFTSPRAQDINVRVFETVYHASLESSCELAKAYGSHDMWDESPSGALQVDMCMDTVSNLR